MWSPPTRRRATKKRGVVKQLPRKSPGSYGTCVVPWRLLANLNFSPSLTRRQSTSSGTPVPTSSVRDIERKGLKASRPQRSLTSAFATASPRAGQALESEFGCLLTVGPALSPGFYYDAFAGDHAMSPADCALLEKAAERIVKENQPFTRLVCSKARLSSNLHILPRPPRSRDLAESL